MKKLTELLNEVDEQNQTAVIEHYEDIVNNFEKIAKNLPLQDAQDLHDRLKRYFNSLF